jgi:uncharacterized membrane protein YagU involved in acid resistance
MMMSSRVNVWPVQMQVNIASASLTILSVLNVPTALMNVLGVPIKVRRSNDVVSSQEISPLSVQHWSSSVLHATLYYSLSSKVRMVIGCRLSFLEELVMMCISSPCEVKLLSSDSMSDSMSSNLTMGVGSLDCDSSLSVLLTLPLLLLF